MVSSHVNHASTRLTYHISSATTLQPTLSSHVNHTGKGYVNHTRSIATLRPTLSHFNYTGQTNNAVSTDTPTVSRQINHSRSTFLPTISGHFSHTRSTSNAALYSKVTGSLSTTTMPTNSAKSLYSLTIPGRVNFTTPTLAYNKGTTMTSKVQSSKPTTSGLSSAGSVTVTKPTVQSHLISKYTLKTNPVTHGITSGADKSVNPVTSKSGITLGTGTVTPASYTNNINTSSHSSLPISVIKFNTTNFNASHTNILFGISTKNKHTSVPSTKTTPISRFANATQRFTTTTTTTTTATTKLTTTKRPTTTTPWLTTITTQRPTTSTSWLTTTTTQRPTTSTPWLTTTTTRRPTTSTPWLTTTTTQRPTTSTPVPIHPTTCMVCSGPPFICEHRFHSTVCSDVSQQYCINDVTNNRDGTRTAVRRCATKVECEKDWLSTTSHKRECSTYNPNSVYDYTFSCSFCCVGKNCNLKLVPDTLYRGTIHK